MTYCLHCVVTQTQRTVDSCRRLLSVALLSSVSKLLMFTLGEATVCTGWIEITGIGHGVMCFVVQSGPK